MDSQNNSIEKIKKEISEQGYQVTTLSSIPVELLKKELKNRGYIVRKKNKYSFKASTCKCGCKTKKEYKVLFSDQKYKYAWQCDKCGKKIYGKNKFDLLIKWNKSNEED